MIVNQNISKIKDEIDTISFILQKMKKFIKFGYGCIKFCNRNNFTSEKEEEKEEEEKIIALSNILEKAD